MLSLISVDLVILQNLQAIKMSLYVVLNLCLVFTIIFVTSLTQLPFQRAPLPYYSTNKLGVP